MGGKAAISRRKPDGNAPEQVLGRLLKEKREELGISQRELAARTDLERSTIAYVEKGMRQPSLSTLLELAAALGIMPSDLMRELEIRIGFAERFRERE